MSLPPSSQYSSRETSARDGEHQVPRHQRLPQLRIRSAWMLIPVGLFVVAAFALPLVFHVNPTTQSLPDRLSPPVLMDGGTWRHPLGTDGLGRDILARIASGARLSLFVGAIAATGTALIGVSLGLLAGTRGRMIDGGVTLLADVVMAIPFIVVGIVLTAVLGQSLTNVLAILILSGWVSYARIVRLQTRTLRRSEFVEASLSFGGSRWHVARRHLLPNLMPVVGLLFFQQIAAMMLYEASLTFLGLGLPVERITLGGMVHDGQEQIFNGWWVSVFPGIVIALAVVGFNLLADWLQEQRDPFRRWT